MTLPAAIVESRVVAIFRGIALDRTITVAQMCAASGITCVEVTLDSPDALAAIGTLASEGFVTGAGTVRSVADAQAATEAGAGFLVAPHTDDEVLDFCVGRDIPAVPGCFTPSEMVHAWHRGAAGVKLFPASVVGPSMVRAVRGPLPDIPIVATGGIDAANARSYLDAGATAVGVGGWLTADPDDEVVQRRVVEIAAATSR